MNRDEKIKEEVERREEYLRLIYKEYNSLASYEKNKEQYQAQAQQDLQKKEIELLKPITEKAKNAILKVGNSQGFDYVLDSSQGQGVIMANGKDLLADVKSELGF